jgi:hypothetical protein
VLHGVERARAIEASPATPGVETFDAAAPRPRVAERESVQPQRSLDAVHAAQHGRGVFVAQPVPHRLQMPEARFGDD